MKVFLPHSNKAVVYSQEGSRWKHPVLPFVFIIFYLLGHLDIPDLNMDGTGRIYSKYNSVTKDLLYVLHSSSSSVNLGSIIGNNKMEVRYRDHILGPAGQGQ